MKAFKRDGVAIVFVSHNMQAVGELCDEASSSRARPASWIRRGRGEHVPDDLRQEGATREGDGSTWRTSCSPTPRARPSRRSRPAPPLVLEVVYRVTHDFGPLVWSMALRRSTDGTIAADGDFSSEELGIGALAPGDEVRVRYPHVAHLARGQYAYELNVHDPRSARHLLYYHPAAALRVDEYRSYSGIADVELRGEAAVAVAGGPASV
jgi:hypothetical protein